MQQPRDFSLYGAVDLGVRQAAAQRRQQAARGDGAHQDERTVVDEPLPLAVAPQVAPGALKIFGRSLAFK